MISLIMILHGACPLLFDCLSMAQAAGAAVGAGMGILGVAGYLGPPILKALVLVGFKV